MNTDLREKIIKELELMDNTLRAKGHCGTIDPSRIHKLRTDIYEYVQDVIKSSNPRLIEKAQFAMHLQTIENKLIWSCPEKEIQVKK